MSKELRCISCKKIIEYSTDYPNILKNREFCKNCNDSFDNIQLIMKGTKKSSKIVKNRIFEEDNEKLF